MRLDRYHWRQHCAWGIPALLLVGVMAVWYVLASSQSGQWLRGGSLPAFSCGILTGAIVLFEMLLGFRKRLRAWRLIPARHWMAAHLWLGMASLPLAFLHSGFRFGGWLPSILLFLLVLAQLSGWFGWLMQQVIPAMLLRRVPNETVTSEIEVVSHRSLAELRLLLTSHFGPAPNWQADLNSTSPLGLELSVPEGYLVANAAGTSGGRTHPRSVTIGAMREPRRVHHLPVIAESPDPRDADKIWEAFAEISSYVVCGRQVANWLCDQQSADSYFTRLSQACDRSTTPIINAMKHVCDQRRQFDLQKRLHGWLVGWIPLHVGIAVALTILLVVHIITALRYW